MWPRMSPGLGKASGGPGHWPLALPVVLVSWEGCFVPWPQSPLLKSKGTDLQRSSTYRPTQNLPQWKELSCRKIAMPYSFLVFLSALLVSWVTGTVSAALTDRQTRGAPTAQPSPACCGFMCLPLVASVIAWDNQLFSVAALGIPIARGNGHRSSRVPCCCLRQWLFIMRGPVQVCVAVCPLQLTEKAKGTLDLLHIEAVVWTWAVWGRRLSFWVQIPTQMNLGDVFCTLYYPWSCG